MNVRRTALPLSRSANLAASSKSRTAYSQYTSHLIGWTCRSRTRWRTGAAVSPLWSDERPAGELHATPCGSNPQLRELTFARCFQVKLHFVNASGTLMTADKQQNSDMFWLAQGGGANADHYPGVVTSLTLRAEPAARDVWQSWSLKLRPGRRVGKRWALQAAELMTAWQGWGPHHPDRRLTADAWLWGRFKEEGRPLNSPKAYLNGLFLGPRSDLNALIHDDFLPRLSQATRLAMSLQVVTHATYMEQAIFKGGVKSREELISGKEGHDSGPPFDRWEY